METLDRILNRGGFRFYKSIPEIEVLKFTIEWNMEDRFAYESVSYQKESVSLLFLKEFFFFDMANLTSQELQGTVYTYIYNPISIEKR